MYSRTIDFNTEPILSEIDKVIKDGLNELLSEHLNRYELLEKTHHAIMNLPSVLNQLNHQPCNIYTSKLQEKEKEKDADFKSKSMMLFTEDLIKKELDKQYESIMPLFEKMLTKIESLSKEVNELKNKNTKDTSSLDLTVSTGQIAVEKENIRLEIEETNEFELENDVYEEPEDTVEEEDEDLQEDAEDNNNELLVEEEEEEENNELLVEEQDYEEELVEENDAVDEEELVEENDAVDEEELGEESDESEEDEESNNAVQDENDVETENSAEESEEESEEESDEVVEEEESNEVVEVKTDEVVEEEEEEELFEIDIDDVTYCTNNEENGFIYQLSEDGDVGTKVGYFKDGEPFFYADEN
jgi:hypothetical protein